MKRVLLFLTAFVLFFSITGCKASVNSDPATDNSDTAVINPDKSEISPDAFVPRIVELRTPVFSSEVGINWGGFFTDEAVSPKTSIEFNSFTYSVEYQFSMWDFFCDYQTDIYTCKGRWIEVNHTTGEVVAFRMYIIEDDSDYSDFSVERALEVCNSFAEQYVDLKDYKAVPGSNDPDSQYYAVNYIKVYENDLRTAESITVTLLKKYYRPVYFGTRMINRFDKGSLEDNRDLIMTLKEAAPELVDAKIAEIYKDSARYAGYEVRDSYLCILEDGSYGIAIVTVVEFEYKPEDEYTGTRGEYLYLLVTA